MMGNLTESLAGRVGILKLHGFSQSEKFGDTENKPFLPTSDLTEKYKHKSNMINVPSIYEDIWRGSFTCSTLLSTAWLLTFW